MRPTNRDKRTRALVQESVSSITPGEKEVTKAILDGKRAYVQMPVALKVTLSQMLEEWKRRPGLRRNRAAGRTRCRPKFPGRYGGSGGDAPISSGLPERPSDPRGPAA
jgi:hypothetical protein